MRQLRQNQPVRLSRFLSLAGLFVPALAASLNAQTYTPPANHRTDVVLDSNWRFIQQNVSGAQATNFDDSSWTSVNLPHTWDIPDGQDGPGTTYYRGIGWYRTHYTVDNSYAGRHFFLKFDGAFSVADVWINGNYLGEHQGGFAAFVFDATPYVNVGADNVIAVEVNNSFNTNLPPLDADFTFWGGIYRDVHLLVTDPVQVSPLDYGSPGVYLTTTGCQFQFRQSPGHHGRFQLDGLDADSDRSRRRDGRRHEYCDDADQCRDASSLVGLQCRGEHGHCESAPVERPD